MVSIKVLFRLAVLSTAFVLSACGEKASNPNTIKVGTIAGPETQLMEVAKQQAQQAGYTIDIVPFTDYNMPNEALSDGSIDANVFQHAPYLEAAVKAKNYKFIVVGKTFVYPVGAYSKKYKSIKQLPQGALVAIPNDPSNEARALLILEKGGLITLKPGSTVDATIADILKNPKKLQFKEVDAAQLPRILPDVDLAVINTNYSMLAGLLPSRDALILEKANSPYANLIVVRQGEDNQPKVKALVNALHSPAVLQEANTLFKGQAIPAWK
ncbi:MAG: MetQ/NlpA family ABC transporter substrate-binding protein [Gammaproteobacteria bacterium]